LKEGVGVSKFNRPDMLALAEQIVTGWLANSSKPDTIHSILLISCCTLDAHDSSVNQYLLVQMENRDRDEIHLWTIFGW
jgi:hypothetical protein